jgi:hypothetical protein
MTKPSANVRKRRSDAIAREDVIRLRLLRMSAAEIAAELGAKPDTVSGILQEPEVIAAITAAETTALDDAMQGLRTLARKAMQRLGVLIDDPDPKIALDAAKTLLTKAGADAPTKSESKSQHTGADGAPLVVQMTTAEALELAKKGTTT